MSRSKKLQIEKDELCRFINREMKMTGNDPRIAELENAMNHKIKRHWWDWPVAIALLLAWICCGCTVVSYDRTFPKVSWYWSKDAQDQREELNYYKVLNKQDEHWTDSATNSLGASGKPDVEKSSPTPISIGQQTN